MSVQARSTIANSLIVAIFTMMLAGIASWMVSAIRENTKAVQANTVQGLERKMDNQKEHAELGSLIVGLNYDVNLVKKDCRENKARVDGYIHILKGYENGRSEKHFRK